MDGSICTCHKLEIKPSSNLLKKNGYYFRGKNKVSRYQCRKCKRVFSFPPKKKRRETRGRKSKLERRKPSEFYSIYEYWAVQLAWRSSKISGFQFHNVLEHLVGLSRKVYLPRVSRKASFCFSEVLYVGLDKYKQFYLPMFKDKEKRKREYQWVEEVKLQVFEKHFTDVMLKKGVSLSDVMQDERSLNQQPFFVTKMLSLGVFEELRVEIQKDSFGIVTKRKYPLEDNDFFYEYFYGT